MAASKPAGLRLAGDIVLSLTIGASFTLAAALCGSAQILPQAADVLLRPGPYLAGRLGAGGAGGIMLSVLGDAILYGSLPFVLLRLRSPRRHGRAMSALVDRRRAPRLSLKTRVLVYGWLQGEPFSEMTETLNVSAAGGLMTVSAELMPAHQVLLINADSEQELPCRVARTTSLPNGKTAVGLEFPELSSDFWQSQPNSAPAVAHAAAHASP